MKLAVILGTVREGRQTERLAKWVVNGAKEQEGTEVTLLDLKDYPMPFFDEAISPRFNPDRKVNEVTQKWLDALNGADAFIFVTPEYNHSIPGVLKNSLDYATWEFKQKPATVVSHGTVGGARATMHLKEILSESRAAIIPTQVAFPARVSEKLDENGNLDEELKAQEYGPQTALKNTLEDLKWYSDALAAARSKG
jgi:NAD(P)H-dependent FMN reductase